MYMELDKASGALSEAKASLGCLSEPVDPALAARIGFLQGVVSVELGDKAKAWEQFSFAARFAPELQWDAQFPKDGEALLRASSGELKSSAAVSVGLVPASAAASVMVNGQPQRACLTLAATCEGKAITTVEGFHDDPLMKVLQDQFQRCGAVQCGFCTAGVLISAYKLLSEVQDATAEDVRAGLSGNICRCTGYRKILDGVLGAAQKARS